MISDDEMRDLIKGLDQILGGPEVFMDSQELEAYLRAYGIEPDAADEIGRQALESALSAWQAKNGGAKVIDIGKARRKLQDLAANDPRVEQLTLAARKGGEMSDDEVRFLIEDLIELGVIADSKDLEI